MTLLNGTRTDRNVGGEGPGTSRFIVLVTYWRVASDKGVASLTGISGSLREQPLYVRDRTSLRIGQRGKEDG